MGAASWFRKWFQLPEYDMSDEDVDYYFCAGPHHMWTIDDALALIRKTRLEVFNLGYTLELGGGVLQNGFSDSDLDLVLVPRADTDEPKEILEVCRRFIGFEVLSWREKKHLSIQRISDGRRLIDLIFVNVAE